VRLWRIIASMGLVAAVTACSAAAAESDAQLVTSTPPDDTSDVDWTSGDEDACSADAACAVASAEASIVPLFVYIVFDRSLSMHDAGKWIQATEALTQFFASPAAGGLRVALDVFPKNTSSCSPSSYMSPLVSAAALSEASAPDDVHEQALSDALSATSPGGSGTPMHAALAGALYRVRAELAESPNQHAVVLLVTDGEPQGCAVGPAAIEQLVAEAADEGIMTYAIGLEGANEVTLGGIAQAGGGGQALMVGSADLNTELLAALDAIRKVAMPCSFAIPASSSSQSISVDAVNVCYAAAGAEAETIPQASQTEGCDSGQGWHYDDPSDPSEIILCPDSCAKAQSHDEGRIDVVFGCETTIK